MSERIHLSKADVTELEEQYVLNALRSGWVAPLGPDVDAFEKEVADRVGVKHALALSSGTAALHLALIHQGAGPGKVVVLPTMTFTATANAVMYTGADPVFVDSQTQDGNVDPRLLIEAIDTLVSEGREIAAVITVDLFGRACDYDVIEPALSERGIPLIEDAAESLGAIYRGRAAGSFGMAAALSFNGNKIMTTSGGGMLLSDDEDLISHARKLSTQAREPVPWYEHTELGYNYRMSNLLAALGRAQLRRLDSFIARRAAIRRRYMEALEQVACIEFLPTATTPTNDLRTDNSWLTVITGRKQAAPSKLIPKLERQNIEARHLWKPMHAQPLYRHNRAFLNGTSARLFKSGIALPSGAGLTDEDIDRVANTIIKIYEKAY